MTFDIDKARALVEAKCECMPVQGYGLCSGCLYRSCAWDEGGMVREAVDEVERLRAEVERLGDDLDAIEDASVGALNDIAALCECPRWEYPGQVYRDVKMLKEQRDTARAEVERLKAERDNYEPDSISAARELDRLRAEVKRLELDAPDRPCSGCGDMVGGDPTCGACWRRVFDERERGHVVTFLEAESQRIYHQGTGDFDGCRSETLQQAARDIRNGWHLPANVTHGDRELASSAARTSLVGNDECPGCERELEMERDGIIPPIATQPGRCPRCDRPMASVAAMNEACTGVECRCRELFPGMCIGSGTDDCHANRIDWRMRAGQIADRVRALETALRQACDLALYGWDDLLGLEGNAEAESIIDGLRALADGGV